ncbi:hypothetical protein ACFLYP_03010 [Chloroflexota bacterium]
MNKQQRTTLKRYLPILLAAAAVIFTFSCSNTPDSESTPTTPPAAVPPPAPIYKAEIYFWVQIPENAPSEDKIYLILLDEVTGLPHNQRKLEMVSVDNLNYGIALQAQVGSIIKYRFAREGETQFDEFTADGQSVRYRLFYVDGPGEVHDKVARWRDTVSQVQTGRITGVAVEAESGLPIANLLILAGGKHTVTATDGSFTLTNVPTGQHQIVGYAMDGFYQTYKQNAQVAPLAETPVSMQLVKSSFIEVTFLVNVPENTVPIVPLRMAGNLSQLGNTFTDLGGGISSLPEKMPQLTLVGPGQYGILMSLPAGADIRYKYTQGDGYWNAEHKPDSEFQVRQFIIPTDQPSLRVTDTVSTWQSSKSSPVWFDLATPDYIPPDDQLYLQFHLYGWMSPIPMWKIDDHRWAFQLLSPTNINGGLQYRYCRNAQCGSDFMIATEVTTDARHIETNFSEVVTVVDSIEQFHRFNENLHPVTVLGDLVQPRQEEFIAGIAMLPAYRPEWQTLTEVTLNRLQANYANTVIFTPTWQITRHDPPLFQQVIGQDMPIPILGQNIQRAKQLGMTVAVAPQLSVEGGMNSWWASVPHDGGWWVIWFEQYRAFILNHADIAQSYQADILILGGDWMYPAIPGGALPDGEYSNLPLTAEQQYLDLIQEIRSRYTGKIAWKYTHEWGLEESPAIFNQVDQIYLHWGISLATWSEATLSEIQSRVGILLDSEVKPFQDNLGIPVIISVSYPSVSGGLTNCITAQEDDEFCLPISALSPLEPDIPAIKLDLQEQVEVYNALLSAINQRDWVNGFVSEDYFFPVSLHDKSPSIHGKPAEVVLRFWFRQFFGK